jgi:hypothetical protein
MDTNSDLHLQLHISDAVLPERSRILSCYSVLDRDISGWFHTVSCYVYRSPKLIDPGILFSTYPTSTLGVAYRYDWHGSGCHRN